LALSRLRLDSRRACTQLPPDAVAASLSAFADPEDEAAVYQWIVWVHILAANIWIGGMLCPPLVLVLALRCQEPKSRRALLVTGIWNLSSRHLPWDTIPSTDLFAGV
jgi:hypothetical protein